MTVVNMSRLQSPSGDRGWSAASVEASSDMTYVSTAGVKRGVITQDAASVTA